MIIFEPIAHKYTSINPEDKIRWISVTQLIEHYKEKFDENFIAEHSTRKEKSKYYGLKKQDVLDIWEEEKRRSIILGNWYHNQREKDILECDTIKRYGKQLPVIKGIIDENGRKIASSQKLIDGIYPEFMVYLRSMGICGQIDLAEVANGFLHITDHKTGKEIKRNSFVNYEGISKKMFFPIDHLEDCNYVHYNIQLSIYMFILLKHNPKLKPGKITLHHAQFKKKGETKYGYPIYETTPQGDYIVENVEQIEMPYLKQEVLLLLKHFTDNRPKFEKP